MKSKPNSSRCTIGVLAGWQVYTGIPDSFLYNVFRGIQAAAHDHYCDLLMACGIDSGKPAWPLLSPDVDFVPVGPSNTDGLIIVSPFASEAGVRYANDLVSNGFPVIYAGDRDSGPAVVVDNVGGIRQAVHHLVDHGHRKIAFVAGRYQSNHGDSGIRLQAFKAEMQTLNLPFDPKLVAYGEHHYEGGHRAIQQIINQGGDFSAVIASNDRSAMGVLDGLHDAGLIVPQDIALIGFDDRLEARALIPPLTTIHYPMFELGYQSVELLLRAIKGESVIKELYHIPTSLVVRESCGCLPGAYTSIGDEKTRLDKALGRTREEIISLLNQEMTAVVHKESSWLGQDEISHLGLRLVEAFIISLEQNDPLTFQMMIKQIVEHVAVRGDDLFTWQSAITILHDQLPLIQQVISTQLSTYQMDDLLHQGRVAISEVAVGQFTRSMLNQTHEADQIRRLTSKFFAVESEVEIFNVLSASMPVIGIHSVVVGYYEEEKGDPVSWCVLQTPINATIDQDCTESRRRFPSRTFSSEQLCLDEKEYQLAILPLKIQDELSGFVAFDTRNLNPCADIVRQLSTALRSVRLYQEAVEARKLAEEANRLKSRFLSMVSHELRTPLNLITGLSNILLDEYNFDKTIRQVDSPNILREDLQRIYISAQYLDGLIRDVLDLASSDMGQLKLVCEPLDMCEVLEAVAVIGEQLARNKGLTWEVEIAKNLPPIWGDRTRLRQVALNLVNNAVKFTSKGVISLTAMVDNGHVVVSVNDTGLGIPTDEQRVIFDEFRQSERTTARGYGGLGLGLAICRKLVEMHDGEIGVCSSGDEGEGSMFFFSLPIIEQQKEVSSKSLPISDGLRVLTLVKDAKGSEFLLNHLSQRGYQVELYLVQEESDWLARLKLVAPDIVMLDLGLTSEHGWEILKLLKENPATKDIPVFFYSITNAAKGTSLLEIDYLTKPVGSAVLAELLVSKGFHKPESKREAERAILVVDDEPDMLELYARIVESQLPGHRVLLANNGHQALEIINQEYPALILLDLMMPELDGFAVMEELRKTDLTRNIPVVVITGQVLTEEDMSRLNSGVASVLGKGMFTLDETLEHLNKALNHRRAPGSEAQRSVLRATAYIHANYSEPISRSDLAASVGLSERHLTRCFHQEIGITPITYLNRYRVKQAKALLDSGEKGITKIAMEVGFSSGSYFTRVFREQVGVSPRAYIQSRCVNSEE